MKGHMQDGKFHPHTEYKGVRKSRDQKGKEQGLKIRKQRLTVASSPKGMKTPTEIVYDPTGDWTNESLWEVKGVTATPSTDEKEIPSRIFVHIINMEEATGDEFEPDEKYVGEVLLIPKWKFIHPEIKKDIASSAGMSVKDLENMGWEGDLLSHSGGIRLGDDESGGDPNELKQRLADKTPAYAGMIGFFLDNAWNRMGTTGWDSLEHLTMNTPLFGRGKQ